MSISNEQIEKLLFGQTPGEAEPPAGMRAEILGAVDNAPVTGGMTAAGFTQSPMRSPVFMAGVGLAAAAMLVIVISVWGTPSSAEPRVERQGGLVASLLDKYLQPGEGLVMPTSNPLADEGRRMWNEVRAFGELVTVPMRRLAEEVKRL